MSNHDDGGPAFAFSGTPEQFKQGYADSGMTLRDWYAGQAMAALIGSADSLRASADKALEDGRGEQAGHVIARQAYRMADAMIAEKRRR